MPFQSPKQRRYMHANLPEIANRWEAKYGLGGIAELNSQLNSLPEYYLPKNQGGRIGFDSGSNGITLGSDKYNIKLEPEASGSWTSQDLGHGYNVDEKNISYGVDTTTNIGPVEIGIDFKNFLDKFDVTKDGTTVEKDTQKDEQIAYMLGVDLDTLYAKIESDEEFENFYFTIRKTFSGGGTPSHEAGIYGLAEGGNIRLQPHTASDLLVQKTSSGERPKYQPPGHTDAPSRSSDSGGHSQHATANVTSRPAPTPSSDRGPRDDPDRFGTTPDTTDDRDGRSQALINISKQKKKDIYEGADDLEEQLVVDQQIALKKLDRHKKGLINLSRNEKNALEVGLGLRKAKSKSGFWGTMGNIALSVIPGLLPAKMAMAWKVGKGVYDYKQGYYDKFLPTDFKSTGKFATDIANTVVENAEKRKTHQKKMDLYKALPDGHPEKIALSVELEIGKKTTPDGPDGNGVETSITIDNIEEVNEDKTQLLKKYEEMDEASYATLLRQKEMQAKKEAYLRNFRQMYMSAQGGRVPGGYNTGGLSNLFRLKNV